jgi:CBS domain containing-hemolysin-like protein
VTLAFWLSIVTLIAATYAATLTMAILRSSRSALEDRLEERGRARKDHWLFTRETRLAVALGRTLLRVTFFALVLVQFTGTGENARLEVTDIVVAGLVAAALLWLCTSVVSSAIAAHASVGVISASLPLLRVVSLICLPLTRTVGFVDEAVRRLTGANLREREEAAEAELLRSIEDTQREGALDEKAAALLENVVEFSSTDVGEVMTPRTDIDGIELTDELAAIRSFIVSVGHSRIPVYEENLDHIVGVLYVKDLVPYLGENAAGFQLRPLLRQPIMIPETKPVGELLADFQRSEVHMAIVIDEYGGTAGLVTIEDVLEEIVGEIQDEHDADEDDTPSLEVVGDGRAEVDGRYHIDDLNEELGLDLPEDEEFDTVGGYLLASMGRVPGVGEAFETRGARFTVLQASPTHIQRVGIETVLIAP